MNLPVPRTLGGRGATDPRRDPPENQETRRLIWRDEFAQCLLHMDESRDLNVKYVVTFTEAIRR